jgi:hypothetical protein
MAGSTLDPDNLPPQHRRKTLKGHDVATLGPSDTSDSGQDMAGPGGVDEDRLHLDRGTNEDMEAGSMNDIEAGKDIGDREMDDTSDAEGTGEHLTGGPEPDVHANTDRGFDRVVRPEEAGLGAGLDQAEEAWLGVTDEDLAKTAETGKEAEFGLRPRTRKRRR